MSAILFQPLGQPLAVGAGLAQNTDIDPRLTRTHYFDGRLLTAEDLTRDQIYLDQRLREAGRVLGSGIVAGLEALLDGQGSLIIRPGAAITPAGRILELGVNGLQRLADGREFPVGLRVDLGDRALIAGLNDGQHRRLNRGLYAVVLRYVEVGTDIAEVFPRDLGADRGSSYAMITEAVQLGLVPMPIPLAQQNALQIRARLIRETLGDSELRGLIPEDAVALGVLAIQDDTPQWLDPELLRRPVREEVLPGDLQADLSRQYERLLADIVAYRGSGGLSDDFHAADYFSLLPPVGTVPKGAIDPVRGRQGFFPENYQVAIAPVRLSDLELIKAESMTLPPIDLGNGEPVDIVVLAPLSNLDYGYYATQLERQAEADSRLLPQLDLLRLKLFPGRSVHTLNTDIKAWEDIWSRLGGTNPVYLRRPTRAAETAISGIVLALGTRLPDPPEPGSSGPADGGGILEDEDTVFLRRINFKVLGQLRPPRDEGGESAALERLTGAHGENAATVLSCLNLLLRIERRYDPVIWRTLLELAERGLLPQYDEALRALAPDDSTGKLMLDLNQASGLDSGLIEEWAQLNS